MAEALRIRPRLPGAGRRGPIWLKPNPARTDGKNAVFSKAHLLSGAMHSILSALPQRLRPFHQPGKEAGPDRGGFVVEIIGGMVQPRPRSGAKKQIGSGRASSM